MPTKARGPLVEDYNRALKAAKKHGWREVSVKFPGGYEVTLREGGGAKPAAPAMDTPLTIGNPTPSPTKREPRINPEWERICNDPERMRLVQEEEALNQQMWEMKRRAPPQPDGRATTMAQLRATSPEFQRLEKERKELSRRIGPDPEMFLPDDAEEEERRKFTMKDW